MLRLCQGRVIAFAPVSGQCAWSNEREGDLLPIGATQRQNRHDDQRY
jgi:hypothetical protein